MTAPKFSWFVPIDGDGHRIGTYRAEREPTAEYLQSVVDAAEAADYHSLLIPTRFSNGLFEESAPLAETWTTATALLARSKRIRLLIAVRPSSIAPALFAQQAATLHEISNGRIDINIVPGGIQGDNERIGSTLAHDDRYAHANDFINAVNKLWSADGPINYDGAGFTLRNAMANPSPEPRPQWYLGGASDAALKLAAEQGDVLLCWIQPKDKMQALLTRARAAYAAAGREPRFGLRTHLVIRDTEQEAWQAAQDLISNAAPEVLAQRAAQIKGTTMVGAAAQAARVEDDRLDAHLWNGISRVRVNLGTAIVGTPQQAAQELSAYHRMGFEEFILSAYPHREGAMEIAGGVLPHVAQRAEFRSQ